MKKKYEAPVAEAVKFEYRDQVVAASGGEGCKSKYVREPAAACTDPVEVRPLNIK